MTGGVLPFSKRTFDIAVKIAYNDVRTYKGFQQSLLLTLRTKYSAISLKSLGRGTYV